MLIRIYWPRDPKRKVRLKRALFGYKSRRGEVEGSVNGKFSARRVKRGIIQVSSSE